MNPSNPMRKWCKCLLGWIKIRAYVRTLLLRMKEIKGRYRSMDRSVKRREGERKVDGSKKEEEKRDGGWCISSIYIYII